MISWSSGVDPSPIYRMDSCASINFEPAVLERGHSWFDEPSPSVALGPDEMFLNDWGEESAKVALNVVTTTIFPNPSIDGEFRRTPSAHDNTGKADSLDEPTRETRPMMFEAGAQTSDDSDAACQNWSETSADDAAFVQEILGIFDCEPALPCRRGRGQHPSLRDVAPKRARCGQDKWRKLKKEAELEWLEKQIWKFDDRFLPQIQRAQRQSCKFQKLAMLYKMQIACQEGVLAPAPHDAGSPFECFSVLKREEFEHLFDEAGLGYKSFCNIFRRAGFLPINKRWDEAISGIVPFRQTPLCIF